MTRLKAMLWGACLLLAACGGADSSPRMQGASGGQGGFSGGSGVGVAPASGAGGAAQAGGGNAGNSTATAGAGAGALAGGGGTAGQAAAGTGGMNGPPPATCAEAVRPYQVTVTALDPGLVPYAGERSWAGATPRVPVAVDAEGRVLVGFTRMSSGSYAAVVAREDSTADSAWTVPDAALGGIAATNDGAGLLLFDPNPMVDARVWAAVARLGSDGALKWKTELFHSPNLEDEGTKGGASSGRIAYVLASDSLFPYFGHTQRYDDGVRHQGGYLASLDASGTEQVLSPWFGSHNLDQRMLVDGPRVAVLGLGDAYPKGIFFEYASAMWLRTNVIYRLAADGVGSTNGQLGGMVDLGTELAIPFITNRSVAQDLNAGTWPDIDDAISMQIRDAAAAGTDLGLLLVPQEGALPMGDLPPVWLMAAPAAGARLGSLKAAKYGDGGLILIAWAENTGNARMPSSSYHTMVVDRTGAVCQPKTTLTAAQGFAAGDDLIARPDGSIVWANVQSNRIHIVKLVP
jgi:hypothetical protein